MDDGQVDAGPRPDLLEGADPAVDWPAEIRRDRRRWLVLLPSVVGFSFGVVLLTGDFFGVRGQAGWWAATAAGLAFCAVGSLASLLSRTKSTVTQAALRVHADPGPALRGEVDWSAREQRAYRWAWPCTALGSIGTFEEGRWDVPLRASVGALLVALFWGALLAEGLRHSREAGRWLDAPPGPHRAMPPPAAWERRRSTRLLLIGTPLLLAALFLGTVVVRAWTR